MASPCEVLVEINDTRQAKELITLAQQEAVRIEQKFSRYGPGILARTKVFHRSRKSRRCYPVLVGTR
jgi:hypothetical protein